MSAVRWLLCDVQCSWLNNQMTPRAILAVKNALMGHLVVLQVHYTAHNSHWTANIAAHRTCLVPPLIRLRKYAGSVSRTIAFAI
jgi:hypothetical protein